MVLTINDGECHCGDCDIVFELAWSPVDIEPAYCPFCGKEIDDIVYETNE